MAQYNKMDGPAKFITFLVIFTFLIIILVIPILITSQNSKCEVCNKTEHRFKKSMIGLSTILESELTRNSTTSYETTTTNEIDQFPCKSYISKT